jgi:hypothetical protein
LFPGLLCKIANKIIKTMKIKKEVPREVQKEEKSISRVFLYSEILNPTNQQKKVNTFHYL